MGDLSYWDVYFSFGLVVAIVNTSLSAEKFLNTAKSYGRHPLVGVLFLAIFLVATFLVWPVIIANRVTQWLSKI